MSSLKRSFSPATTLLVAAIVSALGVLSPAHAGVTTRVFASRGQFVPGETKNHVPVVHLHGSKLVFTNLDPFAFSAHTLTADALACPTCGPLFDTGDVGYSKSKTLDLSKLKNGTYSFHCNHHTMRGTIRIVGA